MATRHQCRLADLGHRNNVDLRQYKKEITETIEEIAPGKNPKIYFDRYETDELSHSESVKIGRALAKLPCFSGYGKVIETYRLFEGRNVEIKEPECGVKGGRMR